MVCLLHLDPGLRDTRTSRRSTLGYHRAAPLGRLSLPAGQELSSYSNSFHNNTLQRNETLSSLDGGVMSP
jgi:hypothetical protein